MLTNLPLQLVLAQEDAAPTQPTPAPRPAPDQSQPAGQDAPPSSTTTQQPPPPGQDPNQPGPGGLMGGGWTLPAMLLIFLVLMFAMTAFSQRKEKKKRSRMLESLQKNDKVVTIGGVIGTIVEVKDSEIVLKVDESSNTRMRFSRTAIQGVVGEENG